MNISIQPIAETRGTRWQVRLDQHAVSFRSEPEARRFVATLEARLQAPHHLPAQERRTA
jgi:hypothetical protein